MNLIMRIAKNKYFQTIAVCLFVVAAILSASVSEAVTIRGLGYQATDNAAYDWQDISTTGTMLPTNLPGDTLVPLDFGFNYYGQSYSEVSVGASGVLGLGQPAYGINGNLLSLSGGSSIVPFYKEMSLNAPSSAVYYETSGTPGSREFVVQWQDAVPYSGDQTPVTFQTILYENSNQIKFLYKQVGTTPNSLPVVGIQGNQPSGTSSLQLQWSDPWRGQSNIADASAVLYKPVAQQSSESLMLMQTQVKVEAMAHASVDLHIDGTPPDPNYPGSQPGMPRNITRDGGGGINGGTGYSSAQCSSMAMISPMEAGLPEGSNLGWAFASAEGIITYNSNSVTMSSQCMSGSSSPSGPGYWGASMAMAHVSMMWDGRLEITSTPDAPIGSEVMVTQTGYDYRGIAYTQNMPVQVGTSSTPIHLEWSSGYGHELSRTDWSIAEVTHLPPQPIMPGCEFLWGAPGPGALGISFSEGVAPGDVSVSVLPVYTENPLPDPQLLGIGLWEVAAAEEFSFGEKGNATLTFHYDEAMVPPGFSEEDISVLHWNGEDEEWEYVTGVVDPLNDTVTTIAVNSFSPFMVVVPEPSTIILLAAALLLLLAKRRAK